MALSLRERRRVETAREIQLVTLKLAARDGLDAVTTEAIAEAARISIRTFFNYYPNKEAAVLGEPPRFPEAARIAFQNGTGAFADDLRRLIEAHVGQIQADQQVIRLIAELGQSNARVQLLQEAFLLELAETLSVSILLRAPQIEARIANLIAEMALRLSWGAIHGWLAGEAETPVAALSRVWEEHQLAAGILLFG